MRPMTIVIAICVCGIVACGGEETERASGVEAQEGNTVTLGHIAYRVVLFRQLNRNTTGDRALIQDVRSGENRGLYAAFVEACNWGDAPGRPTRTIVLEDAFGKAYQPVTSGLDESLTYTPRDLQPEECVPAVDTVAERVFSGGAVVFDLPYASTQERPLVLEIRAAGDRESIVLDL